MIRVGDLTPIRDFTFVEDTAAAFTAAGSSNAVSFGVPYNAGSGKAVTMKEVVDLVLKLTDCNKPIVQEVGRLRPPKSEVKELLADYNSFNKATGWSPKIEFTEGVKRTVTWWRSQFEEGRVRREVSYAT